MAEEKFKLPRSSYEELTKIIKAYTHFEKPASLDDISKLTGVHPTVISANAGFLTNLGIIESGAKKTNTEIGKTLGRALEHEMPDEIRMCWRNIVANCDFLDKLLSSIKIRNGMDESTLESHIAYSAGQPKRADMMTGARTIIDILRAAELVIAEDGKYVVNSKIPEQKNYTQCIPCENVATKDIVPLNQKIIEKIGYGNNTVINLNISFNIDCKPDDLENIGKKLKSIINDIKNGETSEESNQGDE
jgi:hypothetical protein